MDPETPLDFAAVMAEAAPIADAAIAAELKGDHDAACRAVHQMFARDAMHAFAGMLRLGLVAALRARPAGSTEPYMPVFVDSAGRPYDPDLPENAAHAFVGRFVAASISGERELQRDLFTALIARARKDADPDLDAARLVHEATHLLVASACLGLRRESEAQRAAERRKHQHPQAPRRPRVNGAHRNPRGRR